mmetsp:Transcript_59626/g.71650  ORF Transcript_59626/g.71650 Transcript_59626/m.71650 type:complete len:532 (+) Transcript_59626:146-1741(+)
MSAVACPYSAKDDDEEGLVVKQALELARTSCPAFQQTNDDTSAQCPFRNAQDPESFQEAMKSVPSSHLKPMSSADHHSSENINGNNAGNGNGHSAVSTDEAFRTVLGHLMNIDSTIRGNLTSDVMDAMEAFSLSAIMGTLADQIDSEQTQTQIRQNHALGPSIFPSSPAVNVNIERRTSLSAALKTGTAVSHKAAENVLFVKNFIRGNIRRDLYTQMIGSLYHVYTAMEDELNIHARLNHHPILSTIHRPQVLERVASLASDLEYFHGDDWKSHPDVKTPSPATLDYVNRIRHVASTNPLLLLAHAYTRYLGDLSGGTVLARVARRALSLPKSGEGIVTGLAFYKFEGIKSGKAFKDWYRATLDNMTLTEREVRMVVGEANVAFALNMRCFEELDVRSGECPGAVVRPLGEALGYYERAVSAGEEELRLEEEEGRKAKCPFAILGGPNPHKKEEAAHTEQKNHTQQSLHTLKNDVDIDLDSSNNNKTEQSGRCPWPFIFFHDPMIGMMDYQTWVVLSIVSCWIYNQFILDI